MSRVALSILDTYKVRWNIPTVVRDVVQNFFDAAGCLAAVRIEIDRKRHRVHIEGPVAFDLDLLRYIGGTTKSDAGLRTAGGFGEGFKICALVLLRDHHVELHTGAGDWQMRATFQDVHGEGGRFIGRELCYDVEPLAPPLAGSFLTLTGVPGPLLAGFSKAAELFHDPQNPKLDRPFFVDAERGIALYHSHRARRGEVYYRRQLRGGLAFSAGGALTVAFDDRLPELDGDRDRRTLPSVLPVLRHLCARLPDTELLRLLGHLRPYWTGKNSLLRIALREAARRALTLEPPRRYVAEVQSQQALGQQARRLGYKVVLPEFAGLGVPTVASLFAIRSLPRDPTPTEARRIALIGELYHALTGKPPMRLPTKIVEGPPEQGYHRFEANAFAAPALAAGFAEGISYGLALAARPANHTLKATTGDRLTDLLGGAIRNLARLDDYRSRWDAADDGDEAAAEAVRSARDLEVKPDYRNRTPILQVLIFAPPGWPLDALKERIRAAARCEQTLFWITHVALIDAQHARLAEAHGVLTVRIGDERLAPRRGSRVGFYVRTYPQEDGSEDLLPSFEDLRLALRKGWLRVAKAERRYEPPWLVRGKTLDRRHRERHDPEGLRRERLLAELKQLCRDAVPSERYGPRISALTAFLEGAVADQPLDLWKAIIQERLPSLLAVAEALAATVEAIRKDENKTPWSHLTRAEKAWLAGRPLPEVQAELALNFRTEVDFEAGATTAAAHLPTQVAGTVCYAATAAFINALGKEASLEAALDQARATLATAIAFAEGWQPPKPEHPDIPVSYDTFYSDLDRHLHPEKDLERVRKNVFGFPKVEAAVEAAWATARAAGLPDRAGAEAALAACLDAARDFEPDELERGIRQATLAMQSRDR